MQGREGTCGWMLDLSLPEPLFCGPQNGPTMVTSSGGSGGVAEKPLNVAPGCYIAFSLLFIFITPCFSPIISSVRGSGVLLFLAVLLFESWLSLPIASLDFTVSSLVPTLHGWRDHWQGDLQPLEGLSQADGLWTTPASSPTSA